MNIFEGWGEEFQFSSGLKDNFEGKIVSATFGYDAKYNNGETLCLILEIDPEDGDEPIRQLYSCGRGWDSADGGKRAVREDGKKINFNKNSAIADFYTALAQCEGVREPLLEAGFTATYCAPLVGLRFLWRQVEKIFTMRTPEGQKTGTSTRLMPVQYLGAPAKKQTKKVDPATLKRLKEIAEEAEDFDDFVDLASQEFDLPEVRDPKFFQNLLAD